MLIYHTRQGHNPTKGLQLPDGLQCLSRARGQREKGALFISQNFYYQLFVWNFVECARNGCSIICRYLGKSQYLPTMLRSLMLWLQNCPDTSCGREDTTFFIRYERTIWVSFHEFCAKLSVFLSRPPMKMATRPVVCSQFKSLVQHM